MEIQVNEVEYCKLNVHYEALADEIASKRDEVLKIFKNAPVPGFRKGKANMEAIKYHYKNQINDSLKRALAEEAFHNTLFEKNIKPLGSPNFNSLLLTNGKFICDFSMNKKPDFELGPYKNLEIPKPHNVMNPSVEAEKTLQELRVRFGDSVPFGEDDFVQQSDSVIVSYEGFVDGEKVDALSTKQGELIKIGSSELAEFDTNLLGMKLGESREFDLVAPEGGLPSLSGKTIRFKCELSMGSKHTPSPLDDSLAKKVGRESFQELRDYVTNLSIAKVQENIQQLIREAVSNSLTSLNDFKVPEWLTSSEARYLAAHSKLDWNLLKDEDKEKFITLADKNVKLSLILDRIRDTEPEAQLSDQEALEIVKGFLSKNIKNMTLEEAINNMNKTGELQLLLARIKDENTVDYVAKNAKIVD